MLEVQQWSAFCDIDESKALELFRMLDAAGYRSVTWSILRGVSGLVEAAGDEAALEYRMEARPETATQWMAEPVASDIFLPEADCVLHLAVMNLRLLSRRDNHLLVEVTAVFKRDGRPQAVDEFLSEATRLLRDAGCLSEEKQFDEKEKSSTCQEDLDSLPGLQKPSHITPGELKAAIALSDKDTRQLLLDIKTKDTAFLNDYIGTKGGPAEARTTKDSIDDLVSKGLLELGVAAICRKTSEPVLVGSSSEIDQSQGRCPRCGKLPKEENIVEVVAGTSLSDTLVLKSRWMLVLAIEGLILAGVPADEIRVPPKEAGSDPLDLAFCFDERPYLLEMKDDDFRPQHAATFGARLKQAEKVSQGVVACTGTADPDARTLLEQIIAAPSQLGLGHAPQRCSFLEGPDSMTSGLVSFLRARRLSSAAVKLTLHGAGAGINPWGIIYQRLLA